MTRKSFWAPSRRQFLAGSASLIVTPALAQEAAEAEEATYDPLRPPPKEEPNVRRNISAFRAKVVISTQIRVNISMC